VARPQIPTTVDLLARVIELSDANDKLRARFEQASERVRCLWDENTELRRENAELRQENVELCAVIKKLEARVEELERRLGQNSQNSSKPPSSDPPDLPKPPKRKPSGRKPGGQPGHEGHQRALVPPDKVDHTEHVWPEHCEKCHRDLSRGGGRVEVGEPERHQVAELPVVRAVVTEWQLHTQCCPWCNWATAAVLPDGVPASCFGPRLQAVTSLLSGVYRLSKRTLQGVLSHLFGVEISLGSVIACEQRTSGVIAPAVEEAHAYVQRQGIINADETGWRQRRKRAWLWVAVTAQVTVFIIHARRGAVAAEKLLGRFAGILGTDRWCAYASHLLRRRQICWAHLRRHWEAFAQCNGDAARIGQTLLDGTESIFQWWHRVRDGTMARSTFRAKIAEIRPGFRALLQDGTVCGVPKVEAMCREILDLEPAMWTFARVPGVEPTNNASERALRPAVLMRKTSFGTHSEDGSRFIERMLTVSATLKQQGRNVVDYLTEACERALWGQRPRSLLPGGHVMSAAALTAAKATLTP
jgi:transposase